MTRSSRFHCPVGVMNKPIRDELWISPLYRQLAVAKFSSSTMYKLLAWPWPRPLQEHSLITRLRDYTWPTGVQNLKSLGVSHLVVHGASGSTSYETIPRVRLETSGDLLSASGIVVQRRDGPRRLRDHDDGDSVIREHIVARTVMGRRKVTSEFNVVHRVVILSYSHI